MIALTLTELAQVTGGSVVAPAGTDRGRPHLDDDLAPEELAVRERVASWAAERVAPRIAELYERGEWDRSLARELGLPVVDGLLPFAALRHGAA